MQLRHSQSDNTEVEHAYYNYDELGLPKWRQSRDGTCTWTYDTLQQLIAEQRPGAAPVTWSYDSAAAHLAGKRRRPVESGKEAALPPPPPLRTGRASFPASGSSLSNASPGLGDTRPLCGLYDALLQPTHEAARPAEFRLGPGGRGRGSRLRKTCHRLTPSVARLEFLVGENRGKSAYFRTG